MSLYSLFTLLVAGGLGMLSQFHKGRRILSRHLPAIFIFMAAISFGFGGYLAFKQYEVWLADPLTKFLLPPYQSLGYFALHSFFVFFAPRLASLFVALAILAATLILNRRAGGIFFEKEEPYLAALSFLLVGYPGWVIYFAALLGIYLLLHVIRHLRGAESRLPLYYLWAATSFFVILLNEYWTSHTHWWMLLKI